MNDYLKMLKARQYRDYYWPPKREKIFTMRRLNPRKTSVWSNLGPYIIPAIAAGITAWQAYLMQEGLTAAERTRAINSVAEHLQVFCNKLKNPPVQLSVEGHTDPAGIDRLYRFINRKDIDKLTVEQVTGYLSELDAAGWKALDILMLSAPSLPDKSVYIQDAANSLREDSMDVFFNRTDPDLWPDLYKASAKCTNTLSLLLNDLTDLQIYRPVEVLEVPIISANEISTGQ